MVPLAVRPTTATALLSAIVLAGMAGSSTATPPPEVACAPSFIPHLGRACLRPDGLYDVVLADGTRLLTHGPDPLPPRDRVVEVGWEDGADERELVCAEEWAMHVLYGHPAEAPSRLGAVADDLRANLRRANALLNMEALASGGVTADFRVRCDDQGRIRIDQFVGLPDGGQNYGDVVEAAIAAGHERPGTDYVIFYDDNDTICGVAEIADDDRLAPDNANLAGPDYGMTLESCWDGLTAMHENAHTQGAVQEFAPDWDLLTNHCMEGYDLMCYPTSNVLLLCLDRVRYDCDHDTYFDAEPEAGEWLATHWNLGSRLNRYIEFGPKPETA